ncbi:hypothetical protein JXC34_04155, partial [Candidatus Woesearchaeota archaeon]|nr:hypothetical protein [Candidatus Woesearchaeota archaeon]
VEMAQLCLASNEFGQVERLARLLDSVSDNDIHKTFVFERDNTGNTEFWFDLIEFLDEKAYFIAGDFIHARLDQVHDFQEKIPEYLNIGLAISIIYNELGHPEESTELLRCLSKYTCGEEGCKLSEAIKTSLVRNIVSEVSCDQYYSSPGNTGASRSPGRFF